MKKFFLTAAVLVAAVTTMSAQKQGEFTVGGNLGVSGGSSSTTISAAGQPETTKTPGTTSFLLAPQFSYFVIDNLEVSAGLEYDMSKEFYDNHNNKNYFSTTHIAMFTIGANYYIPLIEDKLFYTPGLQFGFGGGLFKGVQFGELGVKIELLPGVLEIGLEGLETFVEHMIKRSLRGFGTLRRGHRRF